MKDCRILLTFALLLVPQTAIWQTALAQKPEAKHIKGEGMLSWSLEPDNPQSKIERVDIHTSIKAEPLADGSGWVYAYTLTFKHEDNGKWLEYIYARWESVECKEFAQYLRQEKISDHFNGGEYLRALYAKSQDGIIRFQFTSTELPVLGEENRITVFDKSGRILAYSWLPALVPKQKE